LHDLSLEEFLDEARAFLFLFITTFVEYLNTDYEAALGPFLTRRLSSHVSFDKLLTASTGLILSERMDMSFGLRHTISCLQFGHYGSLKRKYSLFIEAFCK